MQLGRGEARVTAFCWYEPEHFVRVSKHSEWSNEQRSVVLQSAYFRGEISDANSQTTTPRAVTTR
jgi:hypothetical protein